MKKFKMYLSSIKSMYFMLLACLTLLISVTSCNTDEIEFNALEEQKQLSKEEILEPILSKIPHTRGVDPIPVMMITDKRTVEIKGLATEKMTIYWGQEGETEIVPNVYFTYKHDFSSDNNGIILAGSNDALVNLDVSGNELIDLDVEFNTKLRTLDCMYNNLNKLKLTGCTSLTNLHADYNDLSTIDVSFLPDLSYLTLAGNKLTDIDVSKNTNLASFAIGYNQIKSLDLTCNEKLTFISIRALPIEIINNHNIDGLSFSSFPQLTSLDISFTSFTSLNLSNNPRVVCIIIEGTVITQLDISNLQLNILSANYSKIENIKYIHNNTYSNFKNAYNISLLNTPLATDSNFADNLKALLSSLPDRNNVIPSGQVIQGTIQINPSNTLNPFLKALELKNWIVYQ
ncbi:MAG: hypothetical protein NC410_08080 [Oscillibacter sp.]|nr:hypothetical protein [Oscillibacter sp.]